MEFTWPEFATEQPLDAGRWWTATFDSYDQYRENCYYRVRLFSAERQLGELMVEVGMEFAGDDWMVPEFTTELRDRIARVADTNMTNTTYQGHAR